MPSVWLSNTTVEYLKKKSEGQSIDAVVCQLLNLGEGANGRGLVVRQIPKEKLVPSFVYTWTILDQLRACAQRKMARAELQIKVHDALESQDLFVVFPDERSKDKRNQPKWKQRFTNALSYLIKMGCIEARGKHPDAPKWQRGVQYRATDRGLSVISDIGNMGVQLCTISSYQPLEIDEIPKALAGRPSLILGV